MKKKTLFRILRYTKPYKKQLITGIICAFLTVVLTLSGPVLTGNAIDYIIGKGQVDFQSISLILLIFLGTILGVAVFQWLTGNFINELSYFTVRDMRNEFFQKLNDLPLSYIDSHPHGDIMSRIINDIEAVGDGLLHGFTQFFTGIMTILGTLVFMIVINYKIALVVVFVTPLSIFAAGFISKISSKKYREQSEIQGELTTLIEETTENQMVVKSFSLQESFYEKFQEINSRLYECGQKAQFYSSFANPSTRVVNAAVYALVGVIGAVSAVNGQLSIGQISCFLTYANQYTKPFNEVTGVLSQLQGALAGAERVFKILDTESQSPDKENAVNLTECKGELTFDNVSFSYTPHRQLIKNFSLKVKSGEKIAIVGPTGCGKTTLINLLMRFYDVTSGEIRLDGIPIKNITRNSLRNMYGMVLQDTRLFSGTIRENISYGKPEASEEEIINAAKSAYAHSFISKLPKGYDTILSSGGTELSQGQKQLLCIARVMLINPYILILDEATSNIDSLTEHRIQKAFDKLTQGKTGFIVAHRLSTIKNADIILVMQNGNIVEQGTHEELLNKHGFYYELYNSRKL